MTELDQLRELLDEAGVSYLNHRGDITIGYYTDDPHSVIEAMDHSLQVTGLTAEQVMRALWHLSNCTNSERMGDERGTCHLEEIDNDCDTASEYMLERCWCFDAVYKCSCGCLFGHVAHVRPRYCPACGRKVVDE